MVRFVGLIIDDLYNTETTEGQLLPGADVPSSQLFSAFLGEDFSVLCG
jgi:hypothetical protein